MRRKIVFLLFALCLVKLYHIGNQSLHFSPNLLINSFKENVGENISLGVTAGDVISIRDFFVSKNVLEFKLSDEILKNHDVYYQRIVELSYPIKMKQNASIFIAHKIEEVQNNCEILHLTKNFNIYECK